MNKIGRNEQCYCGSKKKYKKCHMNSDDIPAEVLAHFEQIMNEKDKLKEQGIYINYVNPIMFKGKKVWAIGSRVYSRQNPNETFHDFIQYILKETLGFDWIAKQELLPENKRHFLIRCFAQFEEWRSKLLSKAGPTFSGILEAPPTGWTKSMLTLAFDVATLKHASNLPESLLHRLRIPDQYQGARYEITVAAIFARLGFIIKWFDGNDKDKKHCEFIATHIDSKTEIAVEAKSRHRAGILHTPGTADEFASNKGDIQRLVNRAFLKSEYGAMPFMIFVDVNAPFKYADDFKNIPWIKDILKNARGEKPITKENPSSCNAIYFTNFSFHYQTDKEAQPAQNLQSLPNDVRYQIPDKSLYDGIMSALHHYGNIPDIKLKGS